MIIKIIMFLMDRQLKKLRESQNTPYIYIKGTGKDAPKYLMYTDDNTIASAMDRIN